MVVRRGKIGDGLSRAFRIGKRLESIDRDYARLRDSSFDLEKIDTDFDISSLNGYEKKDYWRTVDLKKRHKNGLTNLSKEVKDFVADYHVSPILEFDGNDLKTGYEGKRRGHRVKGWFRFSIWDPEWFLSLEFPKPPRRLTEVFK